MYVPPDRLMALWIIVKALFGRDKRYRRLVQVTADAIDTDMQADWPNGVQYLVCDGDVRCGDQLAFVADEAMIGAYSEGYVNLLPAC